MAGGVVFGLLWAATGIVLGLRWWSERARWRTTASASAAIVETPRIRFGAVAQDGSIRRLAAMFLAYASGASVVSIGLFTSAPVLLGVGALLVNVGTVFRFLVLAMDRSQLGSPVIPTNRAPRHLRQGVVPGFVELAN